jgi:predicted metal-dependent HD superfamily phosphohydrolase
MNESNEQLLSAARNYVTDIYTHQLKPDFVFHNLEHTEDVVEACSYMADYYKLNDEDRFVLMLAAWFHDTGYSRGEAAGHEEESNKIASQFLLQHAVDPVVVQRVSSAIQATRMPQSPISQVEKILCDADLYHLATEDFKPKNQLLKQERETLFEHKISKKDWRKNNINFLENHKYFTEYGQEYLEAKKLENLSLLQKKKPDKVVEEELVAENEEFPFVPTKAADNKALLKETERGVQTLFRTTSNNHMELSSMADNKSHIMISVNSIIISVTLSVLVARISFYPQFIAPASLLLLTCLVSLTFAILATRPSVSSGKFTEDDIRSKKTNLLFFGNFHQMQLQDYQWGMNQMIKDREYLYNTMMMDIYYLGVVLAKKYRYLRIAYTIFMWGLILSVIAFALAALYTTGNSTTTSSGKVIDY